MTSDELISLDNDTKELISEYFLSSFKSEKFFYLSQTSDAPNAVYASANEIFDNVNNLNDDNNNCLHTKSIELANLLYEKSTHPNIKGGEFYTVYFKNCYLNGNTVNAVGLFKTEKKESYLKVEQQKQTFHINNESGINVENLDKGCLIFNTDAENGYWVSIVDKSGKGVEAKYWVDEFLGLKLRGNDFTQTQDFMKVYKNFVTDKLPEVTDTTRVEQVSLLNKSMDFFKENEQFDKEEFANSVFTENEVSLFDSYLEEIEEKETLNIQESFPISEVAVKKQSRNFRKIIKLDSNFDIYVRGNQEKIAKGHDDEGTFYKIYFDEEK